MGGREQRGKRVPSARAFVLFTHEVSSAADFSLTPPPQVSVARDDVVRDTLLVTSAMLELRGYASRVGGEPDACTELFWLLIVTVLKAMSNWVLCVGTTDVEPQHRQRVMRERGVIPVPHAELGFCSQ